MALDRWADKILTSLRGRRIGLDANEYLTGPAGYRDGIETITTAASALTPSGISNLACASSSTALTLAGCSKAVLGLTKTINNLSTGVVMSITLGAGYFGTSTGSTSSTIATFTTDVGQSLSLQYVSTATAKVISAYGSTSITYA